MIKKCSKCGIDKSLDYFNKDKHQNNGLCCWCRKCQIQYRNNNKKKIANKDKEYRENNKEEIT